MTEYELKRKVERLEDENRMLRQRALDAKALAPKRVASAEITKQKKRAERAEAQVVELKSQLAAAQALLDESA